MTRQELEFQDGDSAHAGGKQRQQGEQSGGQATSTSVNMASASDAFDSANIDNVAEQLKKIAEKMEQEIRDGAIELESLGQQITIRIRENGSFAAGSAFLQPQFVPVVVKIGTVLSDIPGEIEVSGHSDISNIANKLYRSNWDLSSQRPVSGTSTHQYAQFYLTQAAR